MLSMTSLGQLLRQQIFPRGFKFIALEALHLPPNVTDWGHLRVLRAGTDLQDVYVHCWLYACSP